MQLTTPSRIRGQGEFQTGQWWQIWEGVELFSIGFTGGVSTGKGPYRYSG
jgi:hypothetical protein